MEFKLEQEKIKAAKEESERQERIRREEAAIKNRQAEFSALERKLGEILPMVNEANLIAAELKRNIRFNTKMIRVMPEFGNILDSKTDIMIKVDNNEDNYYYQWQSDKFANRLEMIRENLNEYFNDGVLPKFDNKEKDPFWDPPEPLLIGTSYLSLKSLGYTLENKLECRFCLVKVLKALEDRCWFHTGLWGKMVVSQRMMCSLKKIPKNYLENKFGSELKSMGLKGYPRTFARIHL